MKNHILLIILMAVMFSCSDSSTQENQTEQLQSQEEQLSATVYAQDSLSRIVFFGNSLTAAYGVDPATGFVAIIRDRLDSLGYEYKVVNAGLSGETSAGGRERIDWILKEPLDIFVLELGGNDGLRGIEPQATFENLAAIIKKVKSKYSDANILIAGMQAPPNMGQEFTKAFRNIYPELADQFDASLIPFLLEGVGGEKDLNIADGIHPNEAGHKIVAENVWEELIRMMEREG